LKNLKVKILEKILKEHHLTSLPAILPTILPTILQTYLMRKRLRRKKKSPSPRNERLKARMPLL